MTGSETTFDFDGSHEANVAAEFYHQCRLSGLDCYLEVPAFSPVHRSRRFRIDCLVVVDNQALCAIEFKASGRGPDLQRQSKKSRQQRAYDGIGIPWAYCRGLEQVAEIVEWAKALKSLKAA